MQGRGSPGQRLQGGPPVPTGVDAVKGFATYPGEVSEQPTESQKIRRPGHLRAAALVLLVYGDGEVPTQPQSPTPHSCSPQVLYVLVFP